MTSLIGQTVSHYTILEKLGEGGMGVVYKAEDTKLKRTVALKFLPPQVSASGQDKERFIQEAQAASAINHPNICTIYSIGEHDGQLFIEMEFVDGQSLHEKKGLVSIKRAIDVGVQLAEGLAAAHEKEIVHRDIKPENIMIRKDGSVQILDFGLAKLRERGSTVTRLTKEGSTIGTAAYMSPEQVQGQDTDHRSDIFSFGIVLYELLAGQLPFKGVHETALAYEIVNVDPAPMSSMNPGIDPGLDAIVLECLEKDPNERTQLAKQIAIDLKRFRRASSRTHVSRIAAARPTVRPDGSNRAPKPGKLFQKLRLWPLLSTLLFIALVGSVWMLSRRNTVSPSVVRFGIALPKERSFGPQDHPAIAVSPDGSQLVYAASDRLYHRTMGNFRLDPIPGTEGAEGPFFSPDGRWIAFFADGKLKKVPAGGGPPVEIAGAQQNRGGVWAADGTIIFCASGRGGLLRVSSDGGAVQVLTSIDTTKNERTHRWPSAGAGGNVVFFTIGTLASPDYYEDATIEAVDLRSGKRKVIMQGASTAQYVETGHLVYSRLGTLFAVPFNLDALEVRGTAYPVVESVSGDLTTGVAHYSIARNGTLVYLSGHGNGSDRKLALIDLKGSVALLPAPEQSYIEPRMSPDEKRVAASIQSGKDFNIVVYDIPHNTTSRLTFGGINRSPVWSPDSRRLAYSDNTPAPGAGLSGKSKVVMIQADGGGTPAEIVLNCDRNYVNCWSRDGSTLIVTVPQQGKGWDLCAIPVYGDHAPRIFLSTKFDESVGSLSPDGRWLAYLSTETGGEGLYVRPFPHGDGKWQIATDLPAVPAWPIWSSDGKTLYYMSNQGIMALAIAGTTSLIPGQPRVFLKGFRVEAVESGVSYGITLDNQHILATMRNDGSDEHQQINVVLGWFDEIRNTVASGK